MDHRFAKFMTMTLEALDFQLSPSKSAKDADGVLSGMVTATQAAQQNAKVHCLRDQSYGPRPRQKIDLYLAKDVQAPQPCLIFLHGGFWQEGDKTVSGFAAAPCAAAGWATAAIGYTLTPEISLRSLVEEIDAALTHLHANAQTLGIDRSRMIIAGHSAGAHLVACLLTNLVSVDSAEKLAGALLISGVYDLAPIARSYVSTLTPMTAEDIATLSPLRNAPRRDVPVHLAIGADETDAFQTQTDALYDTWKSRLDTLHLHRTPGKDHFDILDVLRDPKADPLALLLASSTEPAQSARKE